MVNVSGKPKGHGSYIRTLARGHNMPPFLTPMFILNTALLSITVTVDNPSPYQPKNVQPAFYQPERNPKTL